MNRGLKSNFLMTYRAALAAALFLIAWPVAGDNPFQRKPTASLAQEGTVLPTLEGEIRHRAAASQAEQTATPAEIELVYDDGSSDGTGLYSDGMMLVVRLTPKVYPVRLTQVRLMFVSFTGEPTPVGKQIRLVAFTDPSGSGRPPARPSFLVDQRVNVPSVGGFVNFPVNGPEIERGDLYVGYQAPRPASGVGFAIDSNGPAYWRGFSSRDDGATFTGPVQFADGRIINPMIRAMVQVSSPGGPRLEELAVDDGNHESGLLIDGRLYVNRLTPTRYPARVTTLRFLFPWFSGQPSPAGREIRLVAFLDPQGTGRPPQPVRMVLDRPYRIPDSIAGSGTMVDIPLADPILVTSGDVYVGYQAPTPHNGVGFAVDTNGPKPQRSFRSADGGVTFTGPLAVEWQGASTYANLVLRALVDYTAAAPPARLELEADVDSIDLSEGPLTSSFKVGLMPVDGFSDPVPLSVRVEPADVSVKVAIEPDSLRPGEQATVTLSQLVAGDLESFRVVVTASLGETRARLEVPAYCWRVIAEETVDAKGATIEAGEFRIRIPPHALDKPATLRVLKGKPQTGFEEYHGSGIYQLDGLPEDFEGEVELFPIEGDKPAWYRGAIASPTVALMFRRPTAVGQRAAVITTRLVPVAPVSGGMAANVNPRKLKIRQRFAFCGVTQYLSSVTACGRFRLFWPINFGAAAEQVATWLEMAADRLEAEDIGVNLRVKASLPIDVILRPLADTKTGECDGDSLFFNTLKLRTPQDQADFAPTPGHELMHLVQALYGGNAPRLSAWWNKTYAWYWMDEAIATWFEPHAMRQPQYIPSTVSPRGSGASDNYITFVWRGLASPPGNRSDQDHGYGASMFLTMAAQFKDRLIWRLLRDRNPSQNPLETLAQAVGGASELSRLWGMFAERYLRGQIYPGVHFPLPKELTQTGETFRIFLLAQGDVIRRKLQAPELSLTLYTLEVPPTAKIPDLTDSVVLAAGVAENYQDVSVAAVAFSGAGNQWVGQVQGNAELILGDATEAQQARQKWILAVVNRAVTPGFNTTRNLNVLMGLANPTVSISGAGFTGVIGREYTFTTRNRNIPANATYNWTIGGAAKQGRSVKHTFTSAGDYPIEVKVRFGNEILTDRATFRIAPDTPAAPKAEVLFEVFRTVRNAMGTSRQMCNEYYITIFDPQGRQVETGSSIARNGAYSTTLAVANGYQYRIRYVYTSPCADSGTREGKFDIVAGRINSVRVETPPCETR